MAKIKFTGEEILHCPMSDNDAQAKTIGEYLLKLSETAWNEGEGFSGKRPFGNSGWEHEIYYALAENDMIKAEWYTYPDDDYKELDDFDDVTANKLINLAFESFYKMVENRTT